MDSIWIPPNDTIYGAYTEIYTEDVWYQYWVSFYYALFMLLCGELGPLNTLQAFLVAIMIVLGALIIAVVFGEMAVLMSNLSMKSQRFQEIQDMVNTSMKNMKLPEQLQIQISDYLIYTQGTLDSQTDYDKFMSLLSPSLKNAVNNVIFSRILEQDQIIAGNVEISKFICSKLLNRFYKPEESLIIQGTKGEDLFFIAKGDCDVYVTDENKIKQWVKVLRSGEHFGEVALIYDTLRTASVDSKSYSMIAKLEKEHFQELALRYPDCINKFKELAQQYNDKWKLFLKRLLQRVLYIQAAPEIIEQLVYSFQVQYYQSEDFIYQPGDQINSLLFIIDGNAEVSCTINDRTLFKRLNNFEELQKAELTFENKSSKEKKKAIKKQNRNHQNVERMFSQELVEEKKFFNDLKNLKTQCEIIPICHQGKAIGATKSELIGKDIEGKPLGVQCIEFKVQRLYQGSVLGMCLSVVNEKIRQTQVTQCKTLTQCTVYKIPMSQLNLISSQKNGINLRKAIQKMKDNFIFYDGERQDFYSIAPVLDYVVCLSVPNYVKISRKQLIQMNALKKFKNSVLRVILRNRERATEKVNIKNLVKNLKEQLRQRKDSDDDSNDEEQKQQQKFFLGANLLRKMTSPNVQFETKLDILSQNVQDSVKNSAAIELKIETMFKRMMVQLNKISRIHSQADQTNQIILQEPIRQKQPQEIVKGPQIDEQETQRSLNKEQQAQPNQKNQQNKENQNLLKIIKKDKYKKQKSQESEEKDIQFQQYESSDSEQIIFQEKEPEFEQVIEKEIPKVNVAAKKNLLNLLK